MRNRHFHPSLFSLSLSFALYLFSLWFSPGSVSGGDRNFGYLCVSRISRCGCGKLAAAIPCQPLGSTSIPASLALPGSMVSSSCVSCSTHASRDSIPRTHTHAHVAATRTSCHCKVPAQLSTPASGLLDESKSFKPKHQDSRM